MYPSAAIARSAALSMSASQASLGCRTAAAPLIHVVIRLPVQGVASDAGQGAPPLVNVKTRVASRSRYRRTARSRNSRSYFAVLTWRRVSLAGSAPSGRLRTVQHERELQRASLRLAAASR